MPASVAAVRERLEPLNEGDIAIVNDPFAGGTHLPDITIVSPIYHANQLIGYAANRAHHADVGGSSPGSMTLSRSIDEEGIRIEPSLLYRRGRRERGSLLQAEYLDTVRTPDERLGDLEAQLAANAVGARTMSQLVAREGIDKVRGYGQALLDYSQAFMARTLRAIPPGKYEFQDIMDDDGAENDSIPIRVRLTIEGDCAIVDLRDSANQVPGCINCPQAVTRLGGPLLLRVPAR